MKDRKNHYIYSEILDKNLEKLLKEGKIIVYPTDTVYGVAGIMDEKIIDRIYKIKNRPKTSPLIALVSDKEKVLDIADIKDFNKEKIKILMDKFWPGGLTIILDKKENVPNNMVNNGKTIGVRMPNLALSLEIIKLAGGILPTTSANISTHKTPKNYNELEEEFLNKVDIIIEGETKLGVESTIIDMTKICPKVIRIGAVSINDIEKAIGKIQWEE